MVHLWCFINVLLSAKLPPHTHTHTTHLLLFSVHTFINKLIFICSSVSLLGFKLFFSLFILGGKRVTCYSLRNCVNSINVNKRAQKLIEPL